MSDEPTSTSASTLDGARVCDGNPAIPESGLRGAAQAEGPAPRLLLVAQSVHDRDAEGDPEAVQSDADERGGSGDLSASAGTPSDNIVLGSLPDEQDDEGLSQDSNATEKYNGRVSPGTTETVPTQNSNPEAALGMEVAPDAEGPLVTPGFDNCVLEVAAFVRGGRPGLERLRAVLKNIYKAHGIVDHQTQTDVLMACNLAPVCGDIITFLTPKEHQSPSWTKKSRPRLHSPEGSRSSTTPEIPA